jgi:selenocysteine lyase/cysteine desulfurase
MTAQLERWRAETPGCAHRIHLNNAGAALMPDPVIAAVRDHLDLEARIGGYEAADEASPRIRDVYVALAALTGADPRNVAIVENATVAFSQALSAFDWSPGDRILTSRADYVSNQLMYLSLARRAGVEVIRCEELPEGGVDTDSVRHHLRHPRARLVALSWIPTSSGLIQDAAAVGEASEAAGVPYLLDACQAVGQMSVDVEALRCDFLAATARKFLRGPRGIGWLHVGDRMLAEGRVPLYPDLRGAEWTGADSFEPQPDARRFENWEFAYALVLGLGAAARYAESVGEAGHRRAHSLAERLRDSLRAVPGIEVLDRGRSLCAIVTVSVPGIEAAEVRDLLRDRGVNTTAQQRADAVLDFDARGTTSHLRLSPHYFNAEGEVDTAVAILAEIAEISRR